MISLIYSFFANNICIYLTILRLYINNVNRALVYIIYKNKNCLSEFSIQLNFHPSIHPNWFFKIHI